MHVPGVSEVGVVTTVHWTLICKNAEREKSRWRRERCRGIGVLRERTEWRRANSEDVPTTQAYR